MYGITSLEEDRAATHSERAVLLWIRSVTGRDRGGGRGRGAGGRGHSVRGECQDVRGSTSRTAGALQSRSYVTDAGWCIRLSKEARKRRRKKKAEGDKSHKARDDKDVMAHG